MFKRVYLLCCFILFALVMYTAFITFKPITKVYVEDTNLVKGMVSKVSQGSGGDIYIELKDDSHEYYINRANQLGFSVENLKRLLLNKKINLWHIKRWTPFTRDEVLPHISRVSLRDSIIFDEIIIR